MRVSDRVDKMQNQAEKTGGEHQGSLIVSLQLASAKLRASFKASAIKRAMRRLRIGFL